MPVKVKGDSNLGRREAPSALIATMVKQVCLLRVSVPKHWSLRIKNQLVVATPYTAERDVLEQRNRIVGFVLPPSDLYRRDGQVPQKCDKGTNSRT